jgi:hypothetical protein
MRLQTKATAASMCVNASAKLDELPLFAGPVIVEAMLGQVPSHKW